MAIDPNDVITEAPENPENYRYVVLEGGVVGWLLLTQPELDDIAARDAAYVAAAKDRLKAYAADKRRAVANGSAVINVGERSIPTWVDPESRGSITGLALGLSFEPELTAPWKGADGDFYVLTSAEIPALALGMMAFIQACFSAEAAVMASIDAETITTTAEIDAASWPSSS